MKTVVSIAFPNAPHPDHLAGVAFSAGSTHLVLSLPHEVDTPEMAGLTIERTSHFNVPWDIRGVERAIRYHNTIAAPLANFAMGFTEEDDLVLNLHDNVGGQPAFEKIISKAILFPHLAFVSVAPRTRPMVPEYKDYAGRCIVWRPTQLALYGGESIPADTELAGTTVQYLMGLMDADHVPYLWTKINCVENFTPPTPPPTP
jgi:hypothetical protein